MYVTSTRKIISSYDVVFDESFSSTLAYTSQPYAEAMAMCPAVSYIPCATYSKEKTGNIITFAQFKERNLLSESCEDAESDYKSSDKSNDDSIMPPLLRMRQILSMSQMMNLC